MTVAELDRWSLQRNWGEDRRNKMEEHLRNFVTYPFDRALCRQWAYVIDGERRKGRIISIPDAWIAATALLYNIPLVTHNYDDFTNVEGLGLISEA